MSRMILALCLLTIFSGCQGYNPCRKVSVISARLQTAGPNWTLFAGPDCACDNCIPHRPFTHGYEPWWDDHITMHTAHCCAHRALHDYRAECGRPVSHHFKLGFIAAYEDLAMNRKPKPPIVPPSRYWNAFYRSCAGEACVDDWFAGYDVGLEMGLESGVSRFHEIYLRRNDCGVAVNGNRFDQRQPIQAQVNYGQEPPQYQPVQQFPQPPLAPTQQMPIPANGIGYQGQ